jgi:hypothetical protein
MSWDSLNVERTTSLLNISRTLKRPKKVANIGNKLAAIHRPRLTRSAAFSCYQRSIVMYVLPGAAWNQGQSVREDAWHACAGFPMACMEARRSRRGAVMRDPRW